MPMFDRALSAANRDSDNGEIGLELSLEELHMIQLRRTGESIEVIAHACVPHGVDIIDLLGDPRKFAEIIKLGLKQGQFRGRNVVAAMPATHTRVMPISYQASEKYGDDAAIGKLMQDRIGDDISEFVIDYMPVQTLYEGKQKLALVAICREETVVNFLELLRKSGLKVNALEIGPIAIRRLIAALQRVSEPQNTMVVNCGREKSFLTLLSDERLLADDEVDFGEEIVLKRVCDALDMSRTLAMDLVTRINLDPAAAEPDPEQARHADALREIIKPQLTRLVEEIQRGLMFAQSESRGVRDNQVYLLGSLARWPGAAQLLASLTDTTVATVPSPLTLFPPLGKIDEHTIDVDSAPEFTIATGLALRRFMDNA